MMPLMEVNGLSRTYGSVQAVKEISFAVNEGRSVSLLGQNGAGKTTTLKMLSGLIEPSGGSIRMGGAEGGDRRRLIGYLPQYPVFYNWMSGLEYLEYAGKLSGLSNKEVRLRSLELLELVGLKDAVKRRIGAYSGGMKQRLGIAQALIHRPKLLILDEPVSALDPVGRREILELIRGVKGEAAVLFSSHVLHDVEEICDEVLILDAGEIVVAGSLKELLDKHRQPLIRVEWDRPPGDWAMGLSDRLGSLVTGVSVEDLTVHITASDMKKAMPALLADLAAACAPVVKLETAAFSLEDLFMKAVGA